MPQRDELELRLHAPTVPDDLLDPPRFSQPQETAKDAFVLGLRKFFDRAQTAERLAELPTITKYSVGYAAGEDPFETTTQILEEFPDVLENLPHISITATSGQNNRLTIGRPLISYVQLSPRVDSANTAPFALVADDVLRVQSNPRNAGPFIDTITFRAGRFPISNPITAAAAADVVRVYNEQALYTEAIALSTGGVRLQTGGPISLGHQRPNSIEVLSTSDANALAAFGWTGGESDDTDNTARPPMWRYHQSSKLSVQIDILTSDANTRRELTDLVYSWATFWLEQQHFQLWGRGVFDETFGDEHYQISLHQEASWGNEASVKRPNDASDNVHVQRVTVPITLIQYLDRSIQVISGPKTGQNWFLDSDDVAVTGGLAPNEPASAAQPRTLTLGESTVIWNSFEGEPAGDPGGWGAYTSFPQIVGPVAPTVGASEPDAQVANQALLDTLDLIAIYHRGLGHLDEQSSHRMVKSSNGGRSWGQLDAESVIVADSGNLSMRSPAVGRLPSGRLAMTYSDRDVDAADPGEPRSAPSVRRAYYIYSDDEGATWSSPVTLPFLGDDSVYGGRGRFIVLSDGTLVTSVYHKDIATPNTYTSTLIEAPNQDGASWTVRGTIANVSNIQHEAPCVGVLSNGVWMALTRVDQSELTVYQTFSFNQGVTWTAPVDTGVPTRRWPTWRQLTDGTIVLIACDDPATAGERDGVLWTSVDLGVTWTGPVRYLPDNSDTATDDQEEADLLEVSPNVVGIISGQERTLNSSARLIYTEVGVGVTPPSRYRASSVAFFSTASTDGLDYADNGALNAQTAFTLEFFMRRNSDLGGTQRIWTRAETAASGLQHSLHINSSDQFVLSLSSNGTSWDNNQFTAFTIPLDTALHVVVTKGGTALELYVNGVNVDSLTSVVNTLSLISVGSSSLLVGNYLPSPTQGIRDVDLSHFRLWSGVTAAPSYALNDMYNGRVPRRASDHTAVLGTPAYSMPFDGDFLDETGNLSAPIVAGSVTNRSRWVP